MSWERPRVGRDQPLTCVVGGVGRLRIYSMADSIRVIKGSTCNLFYGLICIILRVSLTIKCKCSLHSHISMGKLKCCTSPPSNPFGGRVSPPPLRVRGWRRLTTFQTIVRGTLKRKKATHFRFSIKLVCHPCFILPGTAPWQFFCLFFGIITQVLNLGNRVIDETLITN